MRMFPVNFQITELGKDNFDSIIVLKAEEEISYESSEAAKYWKGILEATQIEKVHLKQMYDIEWCENWVKHVAAVQKQTRQLIRNKMKTRFETILVPQNMTGINFPISSLAGKITCEQPLISSNFSNQVKC